jgi:Fe-Mn family superoxide dismutase
MLPAQYRWLEAEPGPRMILEALKEYGTLEAPGAADNPKIIGWQDELEAAGLGRFGSGWAWLIVNKTGKLEIISLPNQDHPIMEGNKAVLGVDVWEHAYYLKYQNRRADYLKAWWNTINWSAVEKNFANA